jgi:hypothetical protein
MYFVGDKGKLTVLEHRWCDVSYNRVGLDVKVSEHFIGSPASKQANSVSIDISTQECHCTRGSKGTHGDVRC